MTMTGVTFRVDAALKEELRQLMSNLGLDMSMYFMMSAKQAIKEQGVPFEMIVNVPDVKTIKAM